MKIARSVESCREMRSALGELSFIPTMGALHEGHLSLIRAAKATGGAVAVSIFVNPTQFGPNEDFARYPRPIERDIALLSSEDVALLFLPTLDDLYPEGFATSLNIGAIGERFEGASRPGHFNAVATIVTKLFAILQPHRAFFGQKDAQQCAVLSQVVRDLNLPIALITCPTIRTSDGLALSSRNTYLSQENQCAAASVYHAMQHADALFRAGEPNASRICAPIRAAIESLDDASCDYAAIVSAISFEERSRPQDGDLIVVAFRFKGIRLIDMIVLGAETTSPA